ncbi:MAG: cytochrome c oxidase subunit 3 [Bacteroidota bacterium]
MANVTVDKKALIEGERPMYNASYGKLMMWFFLVSDAFTFSALLIAYGALRVRSVAHGEAWAFPEDVFTHTPLLYEIWHIDSPLVFVGIMTFILILSSVTMVLAVEAGHRKSKKEVSKWVFLTIIGGAAFLSCQAYEWYHFIIGTHEGGMELGPKAMAYLDSREIPGLEEGDPLIVYPILKSEDRFQVKEVRKQGNGYMIANDSLAQLLSYEREIFKRLYFSDKLQLTEQLEPAERVKRIKSLVDDINRFGASKNHNIRVSASLSGDPETVLANLKEELPAKMSVKFVDGGANLKSNEYGPPDFAALFFFVTGFHGTHVLSGVLLLIMLLVNINKGTYEKRGHYEMTEKIGLYWHFVDLVWVFVFTFFYLV